MLGKTKVPLPCQGLDGLRSMQMWPVNFFMFMFLTCLPWSYFASVKTQKGLPDVISIGVRQGPQLPENGSNSMRN